MADKASIARRKANALERICKTAEKMGGERAARNVEEAKRKMGRNESYETLFFEAVADAIEVSAGGMVPDPTPIRGNLKSLPPGVEDVLAEKGITTMHDLRLTSDAELLSIPRIGPGTLQRIKANL